MIVFAVVLTTVLSRVHHPFLLLFVVGILLYIRCLSLPKGTNHYSIEGIKKSLYTMCTHDLLIVKYNKPK